MSRKDERLEYYGVTRPISLSGPSHSDIERNKKMIEELKQQGSFESPEMSQKRIAVLKILQTLTREFVFLIGLQKQMPETMARAAGGKLFTFGSYRLDVYGPGSDIDALIVVPKHVSRNDFFVVFEQLLRQQPDLEEINPVPDAFVPIIKFKMSGISVDLIVAHLDIPTIPPNLTLDDKNLLKNIDDKDLLSLNGTRVTDEILRLVPSIVVFKYALRAIKLWAQRRAIYGNIMGFPGGVAWAMLVARICQLYPNAVAATIVEKFFHIFQRWNWPQPVYLKYVEDGPLSVRVWNPKIYPLDKTHRMPIITPAYPSICATHNVTASTLEIIVSELERGSQVMHEITSGRKPWSELFGKHDFFHAYKYYLSICAATRGSVEEHSKWSGLVESKIRLLAQKLEVLPTIVICHPFVYTFDKSYLVSEEEAVKIADGESIPGIDPLPNEKVREAEPGKIIVHVTILYIGLEIRLENADEMQEEEDVALEYKTWKENCPMMYSKLSESVLDWQSLTIEFLPKTCDLPATPTDPDVWNVDLVLGTYTSDDKQNYLMLGRAQFSDTHKVKSTVSIGRRFKHAGEVNRARAMPQNNSVVATASAHGTVYLYDTAVAEHDTYVHKLETHAGNGYGLSWNAYTPGLLLSCVDDGELALWDTNAHKLVSKSVKECGGLNDIAWKNEFLFGYACEDGSFGIDDSRDWTKPVFTKQDAHGDAVNSIAFSYASEYVLATASADKSIALWDTRNLDTRLHTFLGHSAAVTSIKWSPHDERVLASGSSDRRVILWDMNKIGEEQSQEENEDGAPELLFMHGGHTAGVSDFAFSDTYPWLLGSVSEDNICQLWQPKREVLGRAPTTVKCSDLE